MAQNETPQEDSQFKVVDEEENLLDGLSKSAPEVGTDSSGNVISRDELKDRQERGTRE